MSFRSNIPRGGLPRSAELSKVSSVKLRVDQNIALNASPAARNPGLSTCPYLIHTTNCLSILFKHTVPCVDHEQRIRLSRVPEARQPPQNHSTGHLGGKATPSDRQRKYWIDNVKELTSQPVPGLLMLAINRKDWKRISAESSFVFGPDDQLIKGLN